MLNFGYSLIAIGFLIGAYQSVLDATEVSWGPFGVGAAIGIIGLILAIRARKAAATHGETLAANMQAVESSLQKIVDKVKLLSDEINPGNLYAIPGRIDDLLIVDLNTFVEARKSIADLYGLEAYAEVMTRYAAGERYLNRVWSSAADGYIDEASSVIVKSRTQFEECFQKLREYTQG